MASSRKYANVLTEIWRDSDWIKLSPDAQWLYLLLISQPMMDTAGVLPLQVRRWSRYAEGMTEDRVLAALAGLADTRFVFVDGETEEVLIRSFVRHGLLSPTWKLLKAAIGCARNAQSDAIRAVFLDEFRRSPGADKPELEDALKALVDTLSDRLCDNPAEGYGITSVTSTSTSTSSSSSNKEGTRSASSLRVPLRDGTITVSIEAREIVHAVVRGAVLKANRDGLYGHTQKLLDDGATPEQMRAVLTEWSRRTDVYPGHLPHIYTELAKRANGASSSSSAQKRAEPSSKSRDWAALKNELRAEERAAGQGEIER